MEHTNYHSKYNLAYCEIFNSKIHGKDDSSSKNIDSHYLIFMTLHNDVFHNDAEFVEISNYICSMREKTKNRYFNFFMYSHYSNHPVIRNYSEILIKKDYISLEIIECVELEGGEHVAIYKTFWLRIIQRKWKRYCDLKKKRMAALLQPYGFLMREIGITLQHSRPLLVSNLKLYNSHQ
jgi:hypothetical protein